MTPFVIILVCSQSRLFSNDLINLGSNLEHPFFQCPFKLVMLSVHKPPEYYQVMNPLRTDHTVFVALLLNRLLLFLLSCC